MKSFEGIYRNEEQIRYFRARIASGTCAHAYLIEAPAGGGKKLFAAKLAEALAMRDGQDGTAEKCRRIVEGMSPDVLTLRRDAGRKTIGVDEVRAFLSTVYLTPSELSFKMYIFDEADRITPQAQNALLKVIEEPPHDVYMVLLCENSLSLLATVRSRTQKIVLDRFDEAALRSYARAEGLSAERNGTLDFAVRNAKGTIGRLRSLLLGGQEEFLAYETASELVELQCAHRSYSEFLRRMLDFVQTRERLEALTDSLLAAYRDIARAKCSEPYAPEFWSEAALPRLALRFAEETVLRSAEAVSRIKNDSIYNINLALSAAELAAALWHTD